ncbi:MAG: hypothetical protein M1829_000984 [Trizodia sp. TS-e1964]|nr:MAG: hypothetical protein M1829_000984 [Trizodia sp. TS-e1964]
MSYFQSRYISPASQPYKQTMPEDKETFTMENPQAHCAVSEDMIGVAVTSDMPIYNYGSQMNRDWSIDGKNLQSNISEGVHNSSPSYKPASDRVDRLEENKVSYALETAYDHCSPWDLGSRAQSKGISKESAFDIFDMPSELSVSDDDDGVEVTLSPASPSTPGLKSAPSFLRKFPNTSPRPVAQFWNHSPISPMNSPISPMNSLMLQNESPTPERSYKSEPHSQIAKPKHSKSFTANERTRRDWLQGLTPTPIIFHHDEESPSPSPRRGRAQYSDENFGQRAERSPLMVKKLEMKMNGKQRASSCSPAKKVLGEEKKAGEKKMTSKIKRGLALLGLLGKGKGKDKAREV